MMRRTLRVSMLFLFAGCMALPGAFGISGKSPRLYNPSAVVTLQGTVKKVKVIAGGQGSFTGPLLTMKSNHGKKLRVRLGPIGYVASKGFNFTKGDKIAVTGSKVRYKGKSILIARVVKMDGKSLLLRNRQGVPDWKAQGS